MRSFYSGSSCLKVVLLALVLHAPISLNVQSASPPQSPPPATRSHSQSTPACSDAPPILKRGKQPDLPPCPDPPVTASAPASSTQTRSQNPSEALIEKAREAAFEFSENLPNFICKEVMARYRQRGRDETPLDVVSAEIIYDHAKETYRNVRIVGELRSEKYPRCADHAVAAAIPGPPRTWAVVNQALDSFLWLFPDG